MKMDVQGLEKRVLDGAKSILQKSKSCIILMEFWASGIERAGDSPASIFELLENLGFHIYEPVGGKLLPIKAEEAIRRTQGRKYMNIISKKSVQPVC
jgi:hypothetical protein